MEIDEISEAQDIFPSLPPYTYVVAAAIKGNRKSKYMVRWALDKFVPEGNLMLKLFYVRPRVTSVPTAMGNHILLSQVRDDIATAYKQEVEWQKSKVLLPYRKMCAQRKVQADFLMIESDDVPGAIADEVSKNGITKLVIGAPSRSLFTRKIKKNDMSIKISESTPSSCTVYAVSKGKLSSIRPSDLETLGSRSIRDDCSETSYATTNSMTSSWISDFSSFALSRSSSMKIPRFKPFSALKKRYFHSKKSCSDIKCHPLDTRVGKRTDSQSSSFISSGTNKQFWMSSRASILEGADWSPPESQVERNSELDMLKIQLRHAKGLYAMAQNESINASHKLDTLDKRRVDKSIKLQGIRSKEEAENVKIREASQRCENAPVWEQYQKFTWEEIEEATSSLSDELKIGFGAHGTVYKCSLHHINVAVKVLHTSETQNIQQELEILGKIRHPHLLHPLGACVERGCLVYEYMENGSLEERLFQKNNTPPIPWFERYRIAWEIASALVFLHNSKPKPIIHRDLKPANVLLDCNFVSKIGDVGLSTWLDSDTDNSSTGPVGTLWYIDPEYQRTSVVSPKCDVYAFGMVILQLLTAKPAMALSFEVESAIDDGKFAQMLDSGGGNWPVEETKELALLGLKCSELRRKDRPDLQDQVLPVLQKLKDFARESSQELQSAPPNHFICPILKEIMDDPCVAADGYTYERKAIEKWLEQNEESPMTNMPIPHSNLLPNNNLLCAIKEWKTRKQ